MFKLWLYLSLILLASNLASAKTMRYQWLFGDDQVAINLTLDDDLYQAYLGAPRPSKSDSEAYYQALLVPRANDQLIKTLAQELRQLAGQLKLDSYGPLELAISFVQALPYNYDECGPGNIAILDYPYVTVYRGSGTCFDKALLGVALAKELGYGAALLYFQSVPLANGATDEHVALGLASHLPSAFFEGFCYVEVSQAAIISYVPKVSQAGELVHDPRVADIK